MGAMPTFSRKSMVQSLNELALLLPIQDTTFDLALYGAACLVLATTLRASVSIIDAVAVEGQSAIDEAVSKLARKHHWPSGWMNDRMRSHLNRRVEAPWHHILLLRLPPEPQQRLRVFVPDWDYMLSLEVSALALNVPIDRQKQTELRYLMRVTGVRGAADLDALLTRYNSGPCEKRRMAALAHSVWRQCDVSASSEWRGPSR